MLESRSECAVPDWTEAFFECWENFESGKRPRRLVAQARLDVRQTVL